ncbi:MAG: SIMPL domain-containing protein, partial [Luteimonas sp.]
MSLSGSALAQVNALPPTRHILVYGDAQARAIPDRFKIDIKFEVVNPNADAARIKVESYVKDVLSKLEDASVPANEIIATSLNIEP